jgi:hypothetical protein
MNALMRGGRFAWHPAESNAEIDMRCVKFVGSSFVHGIF